ncbi:hypothetical protein V6C03_06450 [Methyloligella sp. 2.7D]|uniref:hypothetical protein n=1 Tax=unclassified Methyloligella TaxID=2625955 RepID=UPI00157BF306|nr:hypothetical protein [Methyloligella sp. GL2]QKP78457.1 hypothetical protein HT051_14000 [Methyloligella sp. GL2]
MVKHSNDSEQYRFTAKQIGELTDGRVSLKTLNNWVAKKQWFTELAPSEKGRPRLFSRANVIEAVLASYFMMAGLPRSGASTLMQLLVVNANGSGGWVGDLRDKFELLPYLRPRSKDWHLLLNCSEERESLTFGRLDEIRAVSTGALANELSGSTSSTIVIPISAIIARIDEIGS